MNEPSAGYGLSKPVFDSAKWQGWYFGIDPSEAAIGGFSQKYNKRKIPVA
jgi:outer membrane scaffolding protein for murein synthesis (MipA/OmpV family)